MQRCGRSTWIPAALAALLAAAPAAAQSPDCGNETARLGHRIDTLRDSGLTPPATRAELEELTAYRQAAERLAQAGRGALCVRLAREALATVDSIERPQVLSTETLRDAEVRSPDGKDMGHISELVLAPAGGRIAYAVVELGGFLGIGERYFPVPWPLFQTTPDGSAVVLSVPRDTLTAAPQFTRDNRPNMADRQWALALHTYYGVAPYWLRDGDAMAGLVDSDDGSATAGQTGGGAGPAPDSAAGASAPQPAPASPPAGNAQ